MMSGVDENPENEQAMDARRLAYEETRDMMSAMDPRLTDLAIDVFALVHRHLYLKGKSTVLEFQKQTGLSASERTLLEFRKQTGLGDERDIRQQTEHESDPEGFAFSDYRRVIYRVMEHEPERLSFVAIEREMNQQMQRGIEPLLDFQREVLRDLWCQCCTLRLLCSRVMCYWAVKEGYVNESQRVIELIEEHLLRDMFNQCIILHGSNLNQRLLDYMVEQCQQRLLDDLVEQCLVALKLKIPADMVEHWLMAFELKKLPVEDMVKQCSLKDLPTDPIPEAFHELVEGIGASPLDDAIHKARFNELMVNDPKRKRRVPSRFCSFHLDGFDLDDESRTTLGPQYQPADYATEKARQKLASYSMDVVSIRVVKAGPTYTYPVEVYGKVIARDEIDYKCVYLFNRERRDAQTINSEKDMLALTGPCRALVSLGYMYFEFDLKIKDKDCPDGEVQFSKGVISYFCTGYPKRIIRQLPSFESTVKLVLQHVNRPLAASLQVSVDDPLAHCFEGKITAGTTRNYRQHMLLYDSSSMHDGGLLRGDGALVLNRDLVAVNGYVEDPILEEKMVLYVCFRDASCEIEDEDWTYPETEDMYEDDDEDEEEDGEEEEDEDEEEDGEEEDEAEEDTGIFFTLKYPQRETVWELGCVKLRVKVDWTAVLDGPEDIDFDYRHSRLPDGCEPYYRLGISLN